MATSPRTRIVVLTIVVVGVEWLLFELVRIPYRPPHDMLTLLGQEKYAVLFFMGIVLVGWFLLVLYWGRSFSRTPQDLISFVALLGSMILVFALLVIDPAWPVTPLDLLLR